MMGYHWVPAMYHYWSTADDLNVQPIAQSMTRDRFLIILSNSHLNDNTKMEKTDNLYKVRPLIDHLNQKFMSCRAPKEYLSIDESMIKFKGRSSIKQYNPKKTIKRGYKIWCISDDDGIFTNLKCTQVNQQIIQKLLKTLAWQVMWYIDYHPSFLIITTNYFLITTFLPFH